MQVCMYAHLGVVRRRWQEGEGDSKGGEEGQQGKGHDGDGVGMHPCTHLAVRGRQPGGAHLYPHLKEGTVGW